MKLKIIKQMLATSLAVSTIVTTPSLVGASKKILKNNSNQSENLSPRNQEKKKKSNRKKIRKGKRKIAQKNSMIYRHIFSQIRLAMNTKSYTADNKQEFAKSVNLLLEKGWIGSWKNKNLYDLIKILDKCVDEPSAQQFVVASLKHLTSVDYFRQYSTREILTMINSLKVCSENQTLKQHVAIALSNLTSNYLFSQHVKDSEKKGFINGVSQIIDMLFWASDCTEAKEYVAKSVWELTCYGILDELGQEKISKIIDALFMASSDLNSEQYVANALGELACRNLLNQLPKETVLDLTDAVLKFSLKDEDTKASVAFAISNLVFLEQFEEYSKEKVSVVVNTLLNCATSQNAQRYFANAIVGLFDHELFKGLSEDEMTKITETLIRCSDNDSARRCVAFAISRMAYYGLFKKCDESKMAEIAEALLKCAQNYEAKKHVAIAIANLEQDNFLKGYSKHEILKITDLLLKLDRNLNKNDSALAKTNQGLKINVENLIMGSQKFNVDGRILAIGDRPLNIGGKGLYIGNKKLTVDGKTLDINAKGVTVEGKNLTIEDNDALVDEGSAPVNEKNAAMAEDDLTQDYDDLVENDEDRIDSNDVSQLVFELARKDLFSQYSDEEISRVIDTLIERVYDFPGDSPNEAANAIAKLASKGLLDKYCEKNLPKITGLLFNLAHDDVGATKESISKAFGELAKRGLLNNLSCEKILNIFYLLNGFFAKDQSEGVEKAVLDAIFELAQKNLFEKFSQCDLEDVFELLQKCAIDNPDQNKGMVAKIIFEIESKNCFDEFFQNHSFAIVDILDFCAVGKCCHEVCDDNGEKHVESDRKFALKVLKTLFNGMFLYQCDQKTIFQNMASLKSCLENDKSCAEDAAELIFRFADRGRLSGCSKSTTVSIVEMLDVCASHAPSASKYVAAALKAMASHNMFEQYSKFQILKIVSILATCSQSPDLNAKEEISDAIYELAHAGFFNQYFRLDFQDIQDMLIKCANEIGADNHSVKRAMDELKKIIASKRANS